MRALSFLVLALALAGCATAPDTAQSKGTASFSTLSEAEMDSIAAGVYPQGGNEVLVTMAPKDYKGTSFYDELAKRSLSMRVNFMRNPGVLVALIDAKPGKSMSEEDAQAIIALAEKLGHNASTRIKIDRVCGPDGKTPLVMADTGTVYQSTSKAKLTGVRTSMFFPSLEAAKEAMRYIDSKTYRCTLQPGAPNRKPRLVAEIIDVREGQGFDEWAAFEPLAKKFGGQVEHVDTSTEEYVSTASY